MGYTGKFYNEAQFFDGSVQWSNDGNVSSLPPANSTFLRQGVEALWWVADWIATQELSQLTSGVSSSGGRRGPNRQCRFGTTALETIPATPVATDARPSFGSPPGLSRAALRQARDAVRKVVESSSESSATEEEPKASASIPAR